MKLENAFTVPVPRADAWKVLLDVERIAPCMPGATLTSRDGDSFTGTVKVKVGPINLTYGGQARFVSLDEEGGVAVIEGSGKETRGTGTAKALITCTLVDKGASTDVQVATDLNVTGKPAQFGRGVLADVSAKLVDRFAACLSEEIAAGDGPTAASSEAEPTPPVGVGAGPAFSVGDGAGPAEAAGASRPTKPSAAAASSAARTPSAAGAAPAAGTPQAAGTASAPTPPSRPRPVREAEAIDLMETAGLPVLKRAAPVVGGLAVLLLAYLLGWRRGATAVSEAVRD